MPAQSTGKAAGCCQLILVTFSLLLGHSPRALLTLKGTATVHTALEVTVFVDVLEYLALYIQVLAEWSALCVCTYVHVTRRDVHIKQCHMGNRSMKFPQGDWLHMIFTEGGNGFKFEAGRLNQNHP